MGASSGNTIKLEDSWETPSSFAEHSMPPLSTPRMAVGLMAKPPGSRAPGKAHGILMPGATLGAPQTICFKAPSPVSTSHTVRRSALGCLAVDLTCATTTPENDAPAGRRSSTSRPAMVSFSAKSSEDRSGFTKLRNQDSANCIFNSRRSSRVDHGAPVRRTVSKSGDHFRKTDVSR